MKRTFFNENFIVSDTRANDLFNQCLLNIETQLVRIFNVPNDFSSFHEWSLKVIEQKPEITYFFEWLKYDSNFYHWGSLDLKEIEEQLIDEFNMAEAILKTIISGKDNREDSHDIDITCSDLADMVYFLDKALKQNA